MVSNDKAAILVRGLAKRFGDVQAVAGVDFEVGEGELFGFLGPNGAGKTTTLKSISNLLVAERGDITKGTIDYRGERIQGLSANQLVKRGIVQVMEGRRCFEHLTVEENLKIGLTARTDGLKTIPENIFEIFPVLKQMLRRRGGDLSGGQQQQLAIGRALVIEPKLLILDEPTEGIQPNIVKEIGSIIMRLNQEHGLTVLLVEQKLHFARRVADHFRIMEKGRVVAQGDMQSLDDDIVRRYLTV